MEKLIGRMDLIHFRVGFYSDFLQTNYESLAMGVQDHNIWAVLTNPFSIGVTALLLVFLSIKRSRRGIVLLGSVWSYGIIYHYTLERHKVELDLLSPGNQISLAPMVGFFAGMILVTFVVMYFVFKGD